MFLAAHVIVSVAPASAKVLSLGAVLKLIGSLGGRRVAPNDLTGVAGLAISGSCSTLDCGTVKVRLLIKFCVSKVLPLSASRGSNKGLESELLERMILESELLERMPCVLLLATGVIRTLAADLSRSGHGEWAALAKNLSPGV